MSTLLITGATGFLGNYILKELETPRFREALDIETIRLLIRSPEKAIDLKSDFYTYEIINGDLFDHQSLEKAANGVDAVIHIAALFDASSKKEEFEKANVEGTRVLIDSLKSGSKFILTSSTGVYGFPNKNELLTEDYEPKKPYWHYHKSKKNQEDLAFELCQKNGIEIAAIRPSLILGPGDLFFIPNFVESLKKNQVFYLRKGGKNILPVVHPSDAARAHLQALENTSKINGEAFHIASFHSTFREFTDAITEELNMKPVTRRVPYWMAYFLGLIAEILPLESSYSRFAVKIIASHTELDLSKIKEKLSWKPQYDLKSTIDGTLNWYNKLQPEARA